MAWCPNLRLKVANGRMYLPAGKTFETRLWMTLARHHKTHAKQTTSGRPSTFAEVFPE